MRETRITYEECLDIALDQFQHGSSLADQMSTFGYSKPTLMKLRREPRYIEAMEALRVKKLESFIEEV